MSGALAERFGDRRAIITGALLYAAGLVASRFAVKTAAMPGLALIARPA